MTVVEAISIREFARRDGCDEKIVRRKLLSGHLVALPDGGLDPALVGTGWRERRVLKKRNAGNADRAETTASAADIRPGETSEEAAARLVYVDGRVFGTEADAKRHKESFLAHQRQLDYDRDVGSVVAIKDVLSAVAAEYALVRNRLLNIATRIAPRAAMVRTAEEVRVLIDTEVALALNELSLDASGVGGGDAARRTIQGRFAKPH